MAPRWPQVNNGPEHINEHATYLKEACNQLQNVDKGRKSQVPWNVIQPYLTSTISLIGKVLRQPAIDEILQQVQDAAKCTQNIQRDVSIIKNSVGLSTSALNAANFSSDRGKAVSWAQVAAQAKGAADIPPPLPTSNSSKTQSSVTAYRDRVVTVKLKDHGVAQRYRRQSAVWIKQQVQTAVQNNTATKAVKIIAAHQLKSGDIQIFTSSTTEASKLKQNREWLGGLGPRAEIIVPTHGVIVHGIATDSINIKDQEATIHQMIADNYTVIPQAEIAYIGWLTKEATLKRASSIVVEFKEPEMANAVIYAGMVWNGHIHQCQLYDRACRIKQCFRCYNYGHIGTQCNTSQFCGYCAEQHETKHCQQKGVRDFTPRCVVCKGAHTAWSNACPGRKKELERVERAKQVRSVYWHVPAKEGTSRSRPRNLSNEQPAQIEQPAATTQPTSTTTQDPEETSQEAREHGNNLEEPIRNQEENDQQPTDTSLSFGQSAQEAGGTNELIGPETEAAATVSVTLDTETRPQPAPAFLTAMPTSEREWTTPVIGQGPSQQTEQSADLISQNEQQDAPHSNTRAVQYEHPQYPLDDFAEMFAQMTADTWLPPQDVEIRNDGVDDTDGHGNNAFSTEPAAILGVTASPTISMATDPRATLGATYKSCTCREHQDIYNDWPTHDVEITVTACMRTCVYCGKYCTTAQNLRRHLRNIEYLQRNISIRLEGKGRANRGTPGWKPAHLAEHREHEANRAPMSSTSTAPRTRYQSRTNSIDIDPNLC